MSLDPYWVIQSDIHDPLRQVREEFARPTRENGKPWVYLCGNSLGLMPLGVPAALKVETDSWAMRAVEGHFEGTHPWKDYHLRFSGPLSRLVGAEESEVVAGNTLTVNLHLLMAGFYRPDQTPGSGGRNIILIEAGAFPSDQYAMDSQIRHHGLDPTQCLVEVALPVDRHMDPTVPVLEQIYALGERISVVMLGAVHYYSGAFFDIPAVVEAAHRVGALVGLDLAHAAGNVPLELHAWGVDFACWCSYKYLNSGPGGPAGLFVHRKHHDRQDLGRLEGWWGHEAATRFDMPRDFVPSTGAQAWQLSNAQIMAMAPHAVALELHDRAGMEALRNKSLALTKMLETVLLEFLNKHPELNGRILTPSNPLRRGCQLSLFLEHRGRNLFDHLHHHGILADWRKPGTIRMAPVPLYNRFADVLAVHQALLEF
jgi:kynureninase